MEGGEVLIQSGLMATTTKVQAGKQMVPNTASSELNGV